MLNASCHFSVGVTPRQQPWPGVAEEPRRRAVEVAGDDPPLGRRPLHPRDDRPARAIGRRVEAARPDRRRRAPGARAPRPCRATPSSNGRTATDGGEPAPAEHGRHDRQVVLGDRGRDDGGRRAGREDPAGRAEQVALVDERGHAAGPCVGPVDVARPWPRPLRSMRGSRHRLVAGVDRDRRVERRAALAARERPRAAVGERLAKDDPGVARVVLRVDVRQVGDRRDAAGEVRRREVLRRVGDRRVLNILRAKTWPPSPHVTMPMPSAEIATIERPVPTPAARAGSTSAGCAQAGPGVRAAIQARDPHVAGRRERRERRAVDRHVDGRVRAGPERDGRPVGLPRRRPDDAVDRARVDEDDREPAVVRRADDRLRARARQRRVDALERAGTRRPRSATTKTWSTPSIDLTQASAPVPSRARSRSPSARIVGARAVERVAAEERGAGGRREEARERGSEGRAARASVDRRRIEDVRAPPRWDGRMLEPATARKVTDCRRRLRQSPPRPTPQARRDRVLVPAELRRERVRDAPRGLAARADLAAGEQPQPRAPQQDVAERARLLAARRVDDLGEQVRQLGDDRLRRARAARAPRRARRARRGRSAPRGRRTSRPGRRRPAAGPRARRSRRAGSRACGTARRAPRDRRAGRRSSSPSAARS